MRIKFPKSKMMEGEKSKAYKYWPMKSLKGGRRGLGDKEKAFASLFLSLSLSSCGLRFIGFCFLSLTLLPGLHQTKDLGFVFSDG